MVMEEFLRIFMEGIDTAKADAGLARYRKCGDQFFGDYDFSAPAGFVRPDLTEIWFSAKWAEIFIGFRRHFI